MSKNLVIFVGRGSEGLEVRIHEENVSLLNIGQRGRRVVDRRVIRTHSADMLEASIQKICCPIIPNLAFIVISYYDIVLS